MKKRVIWLGSLLAGAFLLLLAGGCGSDRSTGGDTVGDGTYLLTVDGYGVTEEEFLLFLGDQKAVAANYFWTQYQLQPDADFWTTAVNGETPLGYAKEKALDALLTAKVTFILAAERGILEYQSYDELLDSMENENRDRADRLEDGETVYGVGQFTPFTYYQYLNKNVGAELEYSQRELVNPKREDLVRTYETYKEYFNLGTVYQYEAVYEDGSLEAVSQSSLEVAKEDTLTQFLLQEFEEMDCGETIPDVPFNGRPAEIVLTAKDFQGYAELDEVEDSVRTLYARESLSELIRTRAETAEVEIDQGRFDALEMP